MRTPARISLASLGRLCPARPALCALALALLASGCASSLGPRQTGPYVLPPRPPSAGLPAPAGPAATPPATPALDTLAIRVRVTDADGTRVVTLPLEEYVLGAVRAELSWPTLPAEARDGMVRIQAIISRTYAISNLDRHAAEGFDLCDGTHCQLYRRRAGTESDNDGVAASVAATRGQILTFEGRAVRAVYHSSCGGHTTAAEHVWSGPPLPYLQPVPDWFCSRAGGGKWSFSANEQQLRQALNADPRTAVGGRLDRIEIAERDAAGRATKVGIVGARRTVVKAEEFRAVMRQTFGPQSIRSTWFSIVRRANLFDFSGVGYGHGVGLCQTGAALRVQAGQSPAAVLAHYYPGTTLEPLTSLATLLTRRVNLHD